MESGISQIFVWHLKIEYKMKKFKFVQTSYPCLQLKQQIVFIQYKCAIRIRHLGHKNPFQGCCYFFMLVFFYISFSCLNEKKIRIKYICSTTFCEYTTPKNMNHKPNYCTYNINAWDIRKILEKQRLFLSSILLVKNLRFWGML